MVCGILISSINIFEKSQQLDKEAEQSEEKYMKSMDPIDRINMNRIKAELITHHKHVDTFWRQRANLKWSLEGDENTRCFHSIAKGN
ncbi:hypothetical protein H5410_046211 [Solanum commersonii]|uniref:Uncharacterized protein n=1 Tax=Solanum commersonii TaxID=4109 RepID=A0A9J5XBN5_SOLCO|nr:hypothetical protein H5410_046211 [Solanum commersonii]